MARKYELKQRAKAEAETRLRIVEATVDLHKTVGGAATTVSAIAERAGVGRVTVYRHFPDERALMNGCIGHYLGENPPPDPAHLMAISDPRQRLRDGLSMLYAYYRQNEDILVRAEQEAPANPILAELFAPFGEYQAGIRDLLAHGLPAGTLTLAAIGHAVAFGTWRSLIRDQGLVDAQAITLMASLVLGAAQAEDQ